MSTYSIVFRVLVFFSLACVLTPAAKADSASSETIYVAPEPIKRAPPRYPIGRLRLAQAGMVEVKMMVDKNGNVFEAVVTDSSHESFENAALDAVSRYSYKPATLNDMPVESRSNIRIFFEIEDGEDAVGMRFARSYKKAQNALAQDKPNQIAIRKRLDRMADLYGLGQYGLAHLNLVESVYAQRFSTQDDQLDALKKILLFEGRTGKNGKFVNDDLEKSVRVSIIKLQALLGYYGDALNSYDTLRDKFPDAAKDQDDLIGKVRAIVNGDKPFRSKLLLNNNGSRLTPLIKRTFAIFDESEGVKELKIRCDRKFAKLKYQPESEYAIPESWGECYLEIIGEPDLTADLVQF